MPSGFSSSIRTYCLQPLGIDLTVYTSINDCSRFLPQAFISGSACLEVSVRRIVRFGPVSLASANSFEQERVLTKHHEESHVSLGQRSMFYQVRLVQMPEFLFTALGFRRGSLYIRKPN